MFLEFNVEHYLKSLKTVSQNDPIIVKQLPVSPLGMPLEIGCFTTSASNLEFERIPVRYFRSFVDSLS